MKQSCVTMSYELLTALAAFAFVSAITPGPNNFMLMSSGMNFGIRHTVPHMLGIGLGFPLMVLLVGAGLMGIFDAVPHSYTVLQTVSALYLLYLAWKIANTKRGRDGEGASNAKPMTFLQAALFQWVNPKAWAMALTAVSVYTPPSKPIWAVVLVAAVFAVMSAPAISLWAFLGRQLRCFLDQPGRFRSFNIGCAVLLVFSLYPVFFG